MKRYETPMNDSIRISMELDWISIRHTIVRTIANKMEIKSKYYE